MKRFFGVSAAILTIAVLFMACPDPNGGKDEDDTETIPVTGVTVARPGLGTITAPIDPLYKGESIELVATVRPASANQSVTWSSSDTGIAAVDPNGKVTGVAIGDAVITATTVGKKADGNSATYEVAFKVKEDPNNITPELRIFNMEGAGGSSTSAVPAFDSNGRLTISNTSTAKGWGTTYDLVKGNTILYWSVPQSAPYRISARVKIKELATGIAEGSFENGFFVGAFSEPFAPVTEAEPLYLAGLNTSSTGRRSVYATRLSNNKYDNSATGSTQFTDRINKEFVFQVSRTDAVYNMNIKDDAQAGSPPISPYTETGINRGANSTPETEIHPVLSGSQSDQFGNRPLYLGFIICGATVEISSIKIESNGETLYTSQEATATPIPPATAVTITNTQNKVSVDADLGMLASVSPTEAIQTVTWSIDPPSDTIATINPATGVLHGVSEGTVSVYATSVSTPSVKSNAFSVEVTSEQEVLENNRSWDFTTVPAGWSSGTEYTGEPYYNKGMTLLGTFRANGIRINVTQAPPEGSDFSVGALQPNGSPPATATNGSPFARIAEVQGPFDITLKYWPNSSTFDRSPSIRIKNSSDADYGAWITGPAPSANTGQTFTHSYTGTDKVTVELGNPAGRHPGTIHDVIIEYKGQNLPIWEWNKGDTAPANTAAEVNGVSIVRTGGTITGTADGMSMGNARWVLGYATPTYSSGTATANNAYVTNAELDLSRKFKITVDYTSATTAGNFYVYLNNNTTSSGSSVFGSSPKGKSGLLLQETPATASGTYTVTVDPSDLTLTAEATTAAVNKANVLQHSFLQFRCDSSLASFVVTKILVENVD